MPEARRYERASLGHLGMAQVRPCRPGCELGIVGAALGAWLLCARAGLGRALSATRPGDWARAGGCARVGLGVALRAHFACARGAAL